MLAISLTAALTFVATTLTVMLLRGFAATIRCRSSAAGLLTLLRPVAAGGTSSAVVPLALEATLALCSALPVHPLTQPLVLASGRTLRGALSLLRASPAGAAAPGITIPAAVIARLVAATLSHIFLLHSVAAAAFIVARVVAFFGDISLLLRLFRIPTLVTWASTTARDEVSIVAPTTAETAPTEPTATSAKSSASAGSLLEAHRSRR
jgi:hypothetical protein